MPGLFEATVVIASPVSGLFYFREKLIHFAVVIGDKGFAPKRLVFFEEGFFLVSSVCV